MSALTFDKSELGNLEYSLQREMLSTDRIGGYMSTTIVCCNTRRYHGLMVAPIDDSGRTYVLLSSLDETVVQHDQTFNLALHRFKGVYEPRGHKYITDFEYTPTPTIIYRVGGVILKKEMLWIHKRTQLMIRYTLVDAHSETRLRLRPFLAFRDKHALTHANMEADGHSYPAVNGVKCRLYNSFPWLYLQTSKPGTEFVPAPDWYYGFEYQQELARGYEGYEDLLTTGYFEAELKKGESIIFSAGLSEANPRNLHKLYENEIASRTARTSFFNCLKNSAKQLYLKKGDHEYMLSGYPWGTILARNTFMSLPGNTIAIDHRADFEEIMETAILALNRFMTDGHVSRTIHGINLPDIPVWAIWTIQQYAKNYGIDQAADRYLQFVADMIDFVLAGRHPRTAHSQRTAHPLAEKLRLPSVLPRLAIRPRTGHAQRPGSPVAHGLLCRRLSQGVRPQRRKLYRPHAHRLRGRDEPGMHRLAQPALRRQPAVCRTRSHLSRHQHCRSAPDHPHTPTF